MEILEECCGYLKLATMNKIKWRIAQWFELRWWKNYLRNKNKLDYLTWKKNYWTGILNRISAEIKTEPTKAICDLGCGPAGIFIALPLNKVTAVDPLINEYEQQTPFFCKADYPNATFVQSSLEDFISTEKFDVVFCLNAINHVYDIEKGFEKLKEVCVPNGVVVVSIDTHNFSFFKYLFRWVPGDVLHPHQYDLEEYSTFLKNQRLGVVKTVLLKREFFFNHYLVVATRENKTG